MTLVLYNFIKNQLNEKWYFINFKITDLLPINKYA